MRPGGLLLALAACGRVGFQPTDDAVMTVPGDASTQGVVVSARRSGTHDDDSCPTCGRALEP